MYHSRFVTILEALEPNKIYAIIHVERLSTSGSERIFVGKLWQSVHRNGYVLIPFDAFPQNDVIRINNRTYFMDFIFKGVDSSSEPIVNYVGSN